MTGEPFQRGSGGGARVRVRARERVRVRVREWVHWQNLVQPQSVLGERDVYPLH